MWRYTDQFQRVVTRTTAEGREESCLVEVIADWIAAGNTPAPAQVIDNRPEVLERFRAQRETYLGRLAGIAVFSDDAQVKAAAKTFRQRLLDVPQAASVTSAPDAAAAEIAIVTLYRAAATEAATTAPAGKVEFDRIAK
jgi:hypothetical protein